MITKTKRTGTATAFHVLGGVMTVAGDEKRNTTHVDGQERIATPRIVT